jgi:hypothetical protein
LLIAVGTADKRPAEKREKNGVHKTFLQLTFSLVVPEKKNLTHIIDCLISKGILAMQVPLIDAR